MRLALIDLGTNTFDLLVTDRDGDRSHIVHEEERPVFLGRGGIERKLLTEDAMERGIGTLKAFAATAHVFKAERIIGFGTSALRNARNAQVFVERARKEAGVDVRIISGEEEATLILAGVRQAVTFTHKPTLVMDIGGGSIEFILATDKALMWKHSFEVGATRLRERFTPSEPITIEEELRMGTHLDAELEPLFAVLERHAPPTLVGSAGTFDTLAAMIATEHGIDLEGLVTLAFSNSAFDAIKERLLPMDRAERLLVPGLPEFRVDTIVPALIAIDRVLTTGIEDLRWSRYALKEGAAASL